MKTPGALLAKDVLKHGLRLEHDGRNELSSRGLSTEQIRFLGNARNVWSLRSGPVTWQGGHEDWRSLTRYAFNLDANEISRIFGRLPLRQTYIFAERDNGTKHGYKFDYLRASHGPDGTIGGYPADDCGALVSAYDGIATRRWVSWHPGDDPAGLTKELVDEFMAIDLSKLVQPPSEDPLF